MLLMLLSMLLAVLLLASCSCTWNWNLTLLHPAQWAAFSTMAGVDDHWSCGYDWWGEVVGWWCSSDNPWSPPSCITARWWWAPQQQEMRIDVDDGAYANTCKYAEQEEEEPQGGTEDRGRRRRKMLLGILQQMPRGLRIPILIELQGGGASGGQEKSEVVISTSTRYQDACGWFF